MSDDKSTDPRTQVLLSLLPPGAVFRHTYNEDALWRPDSRGYVNERDPLRAGLYQPDGHYAPYALSGERPNEHSYTIDAAEYLRKYTVQDGTTLALLIDEVLQLRARLAVSDAAIDGAMEQVGDVQPELCRLERECERLRAALTDSAAPPLRAWSPASSEPPATRDVGRVVVVSPIISDEADDYLNDRLMNAGVWHITWISDPAKAAERAQEIGAAVLTVTAADVRGEFVTHVREDGRRVTLADWCASINPGRHASDCEDDDA